MSGIEKLSFSFIAKWPESKYFWFAGYTVSLFTTQVFRSSTKESQTFLKQVVQLASNKTLLPLKISHQYHFSRFSMYVLIFDICFSLSELLHSV